MSGVETTHVHRPIRKSQEKVLDDLIAHQEALYLDGISFGSGEMFMRRRLECLVEIDKLRKEKKRLRESRRFG